MKRKIELCNAHVSFYSGILLFFNFNAPLHNHDTFRWVIWQVSNPRCFNYSSWVTLDIIVRLSFQGYLAVKTRASSTGIQPNIVSLNGMMRQTGCLRFRRQTVTVRLTWFTSCTPGTTGSGPSPPHILDFRSRALVRSNPGTSFYASPYRLCPTSLK